MTLSSLQRDDYQKFSFSEDGRIIDVGQRMKDKLSAIPLGEMEGKRVLDIGCDMGFWSFLCSEQGADVVGIDRSRNVKGEHLDLIDYNRWTASQFEMHEDCQFFPINLGRQWHTFGKFDLVLMFSLYHHVFEQSKDHNPIWFWLWQHGPVLWENPLDIKDKVVQMNVSQEYSQKEIFKAAGQWFNWDYIGPAMHEPHRYVFKFTPKKFGKKVYLTRRMSGAGGASKAWKHEGNRRQEEFFQATGKRVHCGSINLQLQEPFDWDFAYYRFPMRDVSERGKGLNVEWTHRWARAYPVKANGNNAFVFRFEGESYPPTFVEVVSDHWIDDSIIELECYGRS